MWSAHALRELGEELDAGRPDFLKRREAERGEQGRQDGQRVAHLPWRLLVLV